MSEYADRPEGSRSPVWARMLNVLRLVGLLFCLFSLTMLPPLVVGLGYGDGAVLPFTHSFFIALVLGLCCWWPTRQVRVELRHRDGFLVVVLFWFVISLLGAIPLILAERPSTLVDAVFEAASGLTTTGATILSGIDTLPHAILYYRAQLNFLGGMGIVVLAVALLPMLGVGGMGLYRAETPGPMKEEKLTPRITETAKRLWYVYVALTLACVVAFWLAGMGPFDALAHGFATMSLGGFSTHDASIGHYDNLAVEVVAGVFSWLAGINFALHFLAWYRRSLLAIVRDSEFQLYCAVLGLLVVAVCAYLILSETFSFTDALAHGFFQTFSVVADNGLVTANYPDWPLAVVLLLLLGSFFGGCAGSTCGGIKAIRFLLLYKQSVREIRLLIRPSAQIAVKIGDRPMGLEVIYAVSAFYFLYIVTYCSFSMALVATGVDLVTAFGSVAGCLNNMGVGLGETAINFGSLGDTAKWLLSLAMILGRLEIFPVLLLCLPEFWR